MGKSNERILCKLSKSEILRLYSIVHVAMETTKTSNFTCQSKSFISIFSTCQVLACELQPFSCHDLANDIYPQTAKTVFSHLNYRKVTQNFSAALGWGTVYSFCSLPRFLLTNISRLPTLVGENRGVGTRENTWERQGCGRRERKG